MQPAALTAEPDEDVGDANGERDDCRDALWTAIDEAVAAVAVERGDDPATWLSEGERTTFRPGLIEDDFRFTSRPTFQLLLELAPRP